MELETIIFQLKQELTSRIPCASFLELVSGFSYYSEAFTYGEYSHFVVLIRCLCCKSEQRFPIAMSDLCVLVIK